MKGTEFKIAFSIENVFSKKHFPSSIVWPLQPHSKQSEFKANFQMNCACYKPFHIIRDKGCSTLLQSNQKRKIRLKWMIFLFYSCDFKCEIKFYSG